MPTISIIHIVTNPGHDQGSGGGIKQTSLSQDLEAVTGSGGGRRVQRMIEQTIDLVGYGGGKETLVQESVALLDLPLPEVITCQATNIGFTSATINGLLEDDGEVICDCTFEWGLTDTYGNVTLSWNKTAGEFFTEILTGLLPDTVYHFRTVSWNGFGISYGLDRIFRTLTSVEETYFQRLLFFLLTEDE